MEHDERACCKHRSLVDVTRERFESLSRAYQIDLFPGRFQLLSLMLSISVRVVRGAHVLAFCSPESKK